MFPVNKRKKNVKKIVKKFVKKFIKKFVKKFFKKSVRESIFHKLNDADFWLALPLFEVVPRSIFPVQKNGILLQKLF